jgi:aminomethyltransferase
MATSLLRARHQARQARFMEMNGRETVGAYGNWEQELIALTACAGLIDLSFRGRLCLVGEDRARFLHGQVTQDVKGLQPGRGCYAALVSAKGKMESDLNVLCFEQELLLDFEPGLSEAITGRLNRYIVADDVQVVDVAEPYGLLSLQGPAARDAATRSGLFPSLPENRGDSLKTGNPAGDIYIVNQPRLGTAGWDVFAPAAALEEIAGKLDAAVMSVKGAWCGWEAFDAARIDAGIPRYLADMDENTFPQEAGIEQRAVSYHKGCYIGQEVLNRIHTMGHVNRALHRFRLGVETSPPQAGAEILSGGTKAGQLTSVSSHVTPGGEVTALGYLRRQTLAENLVAAQEGKTWRLEVVGPVSL